MVVLEAFTAVDGDDDGDDIRRYFCAPHSRAAALPGRRRLSGVSSLARTARDRRGAIGLKYRCTKSSPTKI